jgi:hypothetical protein
MKGPTPHPWIVRQIKGDCFVEGNEVVGTTVAGDYKREILGDEDYPSKLADAHLTAAAHDLRNALENLLFAVEHGAGCASWDERKANAHAAIRMARGEQA